MLYLKSTLECQNSRGLRLLESNGTDALSHLGIFRELSFQKKTKPKTIFKTRGARSFVLSNCFEPEFYDRHVYFQK